MGKREDLNRHHTIRLTKDEPPRRHLSPLVMLAMIVAVGMMLGVLNDKGAAKPASVSSAASPSSSSAAPTREELFALVQLVAAGQWGSETMDYCILLGKAFADAGDADASSYLSLLAGEAVSRPAEELIALLAPEEATAALYREALARSQAAHGHG